MPRESTILIRLSPSSPAALIPLCVALGFDSDGSSCCSAANALGNLYFSFCHPSVVDAARGFHQRFIKDVHEDPAPLGTRRTAQTVGGDCEPEEHSYIAFMPNCMKIQSINKCKRHLWSMLMACGSRGRISRTGLGLIRSRRTRVDAKLSGHGSPSLTNLPAPHQPSGTIPSAVPASRTHVFHCYPLIPSPGGDEGSLVLRTVLMTPHRTFTVAIVSSLLGSITQFS